MTPTTPGDAEPRGVLLSILGLWTSMGLADRTFDLAEVLDRLIASPDLPTVCGSTWTAEQVAEFIHAAEEAGTLRRVIASEEFGIGRVHFSAWCPTEYRSASSTTEEGE